MDLNGECLCVYETLFIGETVHYQKLKLFQLRICKLLITI